MSLLHNSEEPSTTRETLTHVRMTRAPVILVLLCVCVLSAYLSHEWDVDAVGGGDGDERHEPANGPLGEGGVVGDEAVEPHGRRHTRYRGRSIGLRREGEGGGSVHQTDRGF